MSQGAAGLTILSSDVTIGGANVSAFGDLIAEQKTPVIQLDFVYGINSQTGLATTANSATVDTSLSRLRLQSGTNSGGSAIFNSKRIAKYRAGEGMIARFTPVFLTSATNSTQIIGVGNSIDGYFFGYNGTTFGILHRNSGTGSLVDTWTAQTAWNGDVCDGTGASGFNWDKTKGVPVQISYPFLGFGDISFYVQNPATGRWILVHQIRYADSATTTQASNPSLYFYAQALNSGNTTNLTMYCGSVGVFICGLRSFVGSPRWAKDNNKTGITTETNIFSLRNATTYNGVTNRGLIRLHNISIGATSAAASVVVIRLKLGVTLGGSPSYATIDGTTADNGVTITSGNSIASADTAGTTITGGTYIWNATLAGSTSVSADLTPFDLFIAPGETLTISGFATSSANIGVSLNWSEDI
jgi:hypothetical protein